MLAARRRKRPSASAASAYQSAQAASRAAVRQANPSGPYAACGTISSSGLREPAFSDLAFQPSYRFFTRSRLRWRTSARRSGSAPHLFGQKKICRDKTPVKGFDESFLNFTDSAMESPAARGWRWQARCCSFPVRGWDHRRGLRRSDQTGRIVGGLASVSHFLRFERWGAEHGRGPVSQPFRRLHYDGSAGRLVGSGTGAAAPRNLRSPVSSSRHITRGVRISRCRPQ